MIGSPFDAIHAHAWHDPIDVPSLNASVSTYIRQCIEKLRQWGPNQMVGPKSTSLLLLGPAGSGKTHLFTRLRQQIGSRAVFVHTRPAIGVEPSPRHVLTAVMQSLQYPVFRHEERQIDVIVGTMLSRLCAGRPQFPLAFLDDCLRETKEVQEEIIECAIIRAENHFPDLSPRYLQHLLRVPFADRLEQRALWAWLAGSELSQVQLDRLGERAPLRDDEVMAALRTLGAVAMFGAPIVLVFDQLENLVDDEGKTARISQYARLVSELRDTVSGLVIVQMALDAVWMSRVHPVLHASMRDRLEERVESLTLPTAEERLELIKGWMSVLPREWPHEPFPYPFTKAQIESWLHTRGMTPRMLMQACGEAYRCVEMPKTAAIVAEGRPDERLEAIWHELVVDARKVIDQAFAQGQGVTAESIRAGLMATLTIAGIKSETAMIEAVPSMTFQAHGRDVLVMIAQQAHHRALAKTLKSAIEQTAQKRVVVLREQAFAIPPTWKEVNNLSSQFEKQTNAVWLLVDRESLARLLATERLLTCARSQDFTDTNGDIMTFDVVVLWAQKNLQVLQSVPVLSILGSESVAANGSRQESSSPDPPEKPRMPDQGSAEHDGVTARELRKLKVASIERLVREIRTTHPVATRASVMNELARMRVKRFGGSIVALEDLWA